ncbi:Pr6Pr family membrane protein [Phycicoccus sp. MAQZ13P-2]|uniref:Pr6Pr family membrane protein n=1 Tax=Phycicoccus mangrovi TaxID=2840470 RepID=UPI001C007008|nr:Pr6Pr family membrane protein [Phycicoccus mangrovi]MBT9257056.1 Pr6Pr family membrane protein [Phycicoccus mangrovi]MBT9275454.1 Pr6Pr family membrane protein [Phycicoccus mangrovi]
MTASRARQLHLVVALVATFALAFQTVLVLSGEAVLNDEVPPLATRLYRLVAYFTIQSNVLVAVTAWQLWRDPLRDGRWWRPVRLAALVGITVTGLVHFVLLRPLLDLSGANWFVDKLLHVVVPVLAVLVWVLVGPRPRTTWRTALEAVLWPVAWTAWTLVVGGLSGWYPYPFLDHRENGVGAVAVAVVGITVLFLLLFAAVVALDRRLRPASRAR